MTVRKVPGIVCFLLLLGVLASSSLAQEFPEEPEEKKDITMDLMVNYGSAYRDGSWVPVDVIVDNPVFNVSGWLEVRTFAGKEEQSPRYRVPVESPKESIKRFRIYCCLARASRIEVMLYHRNRPVLETPIWQELQPIEKNDFITLILDEEPSDYGFLYNALQEGEETRRIHREALKTETLRALAEQLACYEPLDLIILGDIDPEAIPFKQRELLKAYVETGGTVIVCLGENARFYKGTWVEEWLGVNIGATETFRETDMAKTVFTREEATGARDTWDCPFTTLTPQAEGVLSRGWNKKMACLRPSGGGYVVALAVDTASRALQGCSGYNTVCG